jgi:serine protease Do
MDALHPARSLLEGAMMVFGLLHALSDPAASRRRLSRPLGSGLLGGALALGVSAAMLAPPDAAADASRGAGDHNITQQVQQQTAVSLPSLHPIVDRVMPAVVNVSVAMSAEAAAQVENEDDESGPGEAPGLPQGTPFDDLLRRFFGERGFPPGFGAPPGAHPTPHHEVMALGSGFIIDPSGYVVTNNHVVGKADKVTVIFQDNSKHPATIVGRDEKTDIALLKIDTDRKLPFVQWGDSDKAQVGDWVVAVGNPFGLGGSVTAGIISALGRDINAGPYDDFLQIDAPINRGNSGGPTFDLAGEVIGINTAIYSPSGGSVGIGFAIPSNLASNIVEQLKEHGKVTRGWLGVAIQNVTPEIAKSLGLDSKKPEGALVASVNDNSPAAKAGLRQGDVIIDANGTPIRTVHDLPRLVAETPVGQKLELTILRHGKQENVTTAVAAMPENPQMAAAGEPGSEPGAGGHASALGVQLAALTPETRKRLHVPKGVEGVVVRSVADDSPVGSIGVQPGDVIVSIDQQPVSKPGDAATKLKQAAANGQILLLLNRHGNNQFVGLEVQNGSGGGRPGRG